MVVMKILGRERSVETNYFAAKYHADRDVYPRQIRPSLLFTATEIAFQRGFSNCSRMGIQMLEIPSGSGLVL
jgi:hypothetical protein